MKILMISTLNLSQPNGGTVHFTSLAKEFKRAGHIIHGIIPTTGNQQIDQEIATKYFDHATFSGNHLSRLISFSKTSINSLSQIISILGRKPQDYDWVYMRSHLLSSIVLLILKLKGFKKIMTEHNGWFAGELAMMGIPQQFQPVVKMLQLTDAKLTTLLRVVVPGIQEKMIENGINKEKILIAGNATDIDFFHPLNRMEVLQKLNLDPSYFYLGFIGDLEPWKGVETAIKAMPIICLQHPQVRLLVIGGGRQLNYLQETYSNIESVKFLGSIPHAVSNEYINCFDLALLPLSGLTEIGFSPIKLYAYAASGKPILASDIRGMSELQPVQVVELHQPGNSQDLAAKAIEMISNREKLSQMGIIAREYAEKHFSWQLVTDKIIQAMEKYNYNFPDISR
jgi:glycosyltransferase involved in cell wall biosynthesis